MITRLTGRTPGCNDRIIHETTAPYTPQQNGVAEKKNRALKEMVNSMLSYSVLVEGSWRSLIEKMQYFDEIVPHKIPRPKDIILNSDESQRDDHLRLPKAIDDAICSIIENNTWVLSDLPPGCKSLGCKWIFKRKMKVDGTIDKFKARLVIQCFRQKEGIDYFDTYAPVARINTIRLFERYTRNLRRHQCEDITRVFKYLRGTKDYGLSYGISFDVRSYSDASWINHVEDSSSTSRWVFLLGGGAIS
ncbi:zinc finger, CCHC-type containing protein [Tanacetum coccineum]